MHVSEARSTYLSFRVDCLVILYDVNIELNTVRTLQYTYYKAILVKYLIGVIGINNMTLKAQNEK